jgi:hypothetical protein
MSSFLLPLEETGMVNNVTQNAMIVSANPRPASAFSELAAYCGWPVLLGANLRRLRDQLHRRRFVGLLFWLDDPKYIDPTTELLRWVRQYNARLLRIVLTYHLSQAAEQALRVAGAHLFLSADESNAPANRDGVGSASQTKSVTARPEPGHRSAQAGASEKPSNVPSTVGLRFESASGLEATAANLLNPALWRELATCNRIVPVSTDLID